MYLTMQCGQYYQEHGNIQTRCLVALISPEEGCLCTRERNAHIFSIPAICLRTDVERREQQGGGMRPYARSTAPVPGMDRNHLIQRLRHPWLSSQIPRLTPQCDLMSIRAVIVSSVSEIVCRPSTSADWLPSGSNVKIARALLNMAATTLDVHVHQRICERSVGRRLFQRDAPRKIPVPSGFAPTSCTSICEV